MSRIRTLSVLTLSTILAAGAFSAPLYAQDAPQESETTAQTEKDTIVVLGTRRTDRSVADSASPVDVISAQEIATQPSSNLLDSLKGIIPSLYVGQNTISDASTFVRAPSLRGLPGDNILVMLNGKRYNRSALVQVYSGGDSGLSYGSQGSDISAIPAIAIKSLQVLREGATAQYGTDAIAGVLNYGLRDNAKGLEVVARYGQTYKGDGKNKQIGANLGIALDDRGYINLSGEYFDDGQTSRGAQRPVALQFAAANPSLANQLPNAPGPVQIWGSSPTEGYKLVYNSAYEVSDAAEVYFFANLARSSGNQSFNYRSPFTGTAVNANGATITLGRNGAFANPFYLTPCPAATPTCPVGGFVNNTNTFLFSSRYPAGFTPRFIGVTKQAFGVVGIKGELKSGMTYDLSASKSRNSLDLSMTNSLNASFGPQSQTEFFFGSTIQKETNVNLDMTYPIDAGFASPITFSAGAEYRNENYTATAGDPQSYGIGPFAATQNLFTLVTPAVGAIPAVYSASGSVGGRAPGASGYGGTSPTSAGSFDQTSYGAYVGAETDITDAFTVGAAGRYEDYTSFGGAFVWKANALYKLADAFSVRGTVGTGFHAPSPGQLNVEILTTNFRSGNQVQTGTYPIRSPIAQYYGAKTLTPEKSTNFGIGFVAKPADNVSLTVDAYSIKVKNRIGISQTFTVDQTALNAQPALGAVGIGGDVNFFINGIDTVTEGVDVVGTYRSDLGSGMLNLTLAYNYNKSRVTKFDPAKFSQAQIINVTRLAPNHRATFSANYVMGAFTLNARENYYGSWRSEVDYPSGVAGTLGQEFGSKFTTDLDVSYAFANHFTLTVGANNMFNAYPDRLKQTAAINVFPVTGSLADGQIYPRSGGPFGMNGGVWYARLGIKY
jgi:iron complex outermembrane receptor protein